MHDWTVWKLRLLFLSGVVLLVIDSMNESILGVKIPLGLDLYLAFASMYFAIDPQIRVRKYREQVLLLLLFPGAFVTALLPFYSAILFAVRQGW
jgi:hypothetical protein